MFIQISRITQLNSVQQDWNPKQRHAGFIHCRILGLGYEAGVNRLDLHLKSNENPQYLKPQSYISRSNNSQTYIYLGNGQDYLTIKLKSDHSKRPKRGSE